VTDLALQRRRFVQNCPKSLGFWASLVGKNSNSTRPSKTAHVFPDSRVRLGGRRFLRGCLHVIDSAWTKYWKGRSTTVSQERSGHGLVAFLLSPCPGRCPRFGIGFHRVGSAVQQQFDQLQFSQRHAHPSGVLRSRSWKRQDRGKPSLRSLRRRARRRASRSWNGGERQTSTR
jgi:hypothetical protein